MDALVSPPDNRVISQTFAGSTITLDGFLATFETYLVGRANYFDPAVRDLAVQALASGGKRIRPALVHACGAGNLADSENLIKASSIVEFVHVATLVHDDVLDDASIRRDRQTVYADRGATAAILLGDALFAHALEMASEFPGNEVCRWVATATRRTCSGEIQQSFLRGDFTLTSSHYKQIIEAKTAELFSVSCRLGSHVAGLDEATSSLACEFGRRLGLAYQIYDDLADVFGREADFGKSLGRDLAHGKVTLPTITLFSKLSKVEASELHEELFNSGREPNPEIIHEMVNLMRKHGVHNECRELLDEELSAIGNTLSEFTDDSIARRLDDLRQVIVDRIALLLS